MRDPPECAVLVASHSTLFSFKLHLVGTEQWNPERVAPTRKMPLGATTQSATPSHAGAQRRAHSSPSDSTALMNLHACYRTSGHEVRDKRDCGLVQCAGSNGSCHRSVRREMWSGCWEGLFCAPADFDVSGARLPLLSSWAAAPRLRSRSRCSKAPRPAPAAAFLVATAPVSVFKRF
jgi:hypothetical protein